MNYRTNPKNGDQLSCLGFGCMRFNRDKKEVEREIIYAIEHGVNYFDTAYIYPGSESLLGEILAKGYRERVKVATKMPTFMVKQYDDLDKLFNKELERLQTDYIDYYFMHMLTDLKEWNRLIDIGILKWIDEKKEKGNIRNIGFSYHGGKEVFKDLIDAFDWEFCMIQYNFVDENNQAGKEGLQYAASKGLPVMIMEPLKGGSLVSNLPKEAYSVWKKAGVERSPAEWAFRWLWNQPEVTVVLSGMNSQEMVEENIRVASETEVGAFTQEDLALFDKVRQIIMDKTRVGCTGCSYCMPCPKGVDIPNCFASYNNIEVEGKFWAMSKYMMQTSFTKEPHNASLCVKCGKCEQHCPQHIAIRDELDKVAKDFDGILYKISMVFVRAFMIRK